MSLSTLLVGIGDEVEEIVRTRALEILNTEGQPVLVATSDQRLNGVLWVGTQNGKGGVSLNADESGNGLLVG